MSKHKLFIFGFFLLLINVLLPAKDELKNESNDVVQITGIVRLVGSAIIPEIIIFGTKGQWYIQQEDNEKLLDLQHQIVTLEGKETFKELTSASGHRSFTRRELHNIKIISINKQ